MYNGKQSYIVFVVKLVAHYSTLFVGIQRTYHYTMFQVSIHQVSKNQIKTLLAL